VSEHSLRLNRPAVRTYANRHRELTGVEARFTADFLAGFDLESDPDLYAAGGGNSFISMSRQLLDGLAEPLPRMDTVLLAYHLPDLQFVEVAGCYLAERCPGGPAVFSVSGQGVGAPFTALRILSHLSLPGDTTCGAVVVLDQSTAAYRDPETHDGPDGPIRDCAVLLTVDTSGATGAGSGAVLDFVEEQRAADPAELLDAAARRFRQPRIVAGHALADRLDPEFRTRHGIVEGAAHRLCTSAWAALAEHWPCDRYTLVADYDAHEGRLFQAGLRPGAPT
jgi:hypothetical protein